MQIITINAIRDNARIALMICWPEKVRVSPEITLQFPHAIIDPVKVIAPIATPNDISIRDDMWILPGDPILYASGCGKRQRPRRRLPDRPKSGRLPPVVEGRSSGF